MRTRFASMLLSLFFLQVADAAERFACNMKALNADERARHQALSRTLSAAVAEKSELPNGYGFRLGPKDLTMTAEWVRLEAKCCPFLTFELEQSRDQGPLWLRITGTDGVKAFIRQEFEM